MRKIARTCQNQNYIGVLALELYTAGKWMLAKLPPPINHDLHSKTNEVSIFATKLRAP